MLQEEAADGITDKHTPYFGKLKAFGQRLKVTK